METQILLWRQQYNLKRESTVNDSGDRTEKKIIYLNQIYEDEGYAGFLISFISFTGWFYMPLYFQKAKITCCK